ncbi:hypothetical protein [Desulfogranum japonicum]|uniref:hypothetical protein n=1 Tax=Desulfogranum japonicum TaxID=231447 RepID=UPI00040ACA18|nr:hypothetical protein [Desulfogranum japonicum]
MEKIFFYLILVVLMLTSQNVFLCHAVEQNCFEQSITLKFKQVELGTIFNKIAQESGVQIIYDEKISKSIVSGEYADVPLREVVARLLRGVNHILTMDEANRTLMIRGFGSAGYAQKGPSLDSTDSNSDLTYQQTQSLYTTQVNDHLKKIAADKTELETIYENQLAAYDLQQKAGGLFSEEAGMTKDELEKKYENEIHKFQSGDTSQQ